MTKFLSVILFFCTAVAFCSGSEIGSFAGTPTEAELTFMTQWKAFLLKQGQADDARYSADIPFSFVCGERSSREWIKPDNATIVSGDWQDKVRRHTLTWTDAETKLVCEVLLEEYADYPAVQWTIHLRNAGTENSAAIHDFKALDLLWCRSDDSMPVLYRSQGSDSRNDDFIFVGEDMRKSMWCHNRTVRMDSATNSAFRVALNSSLFDSDTRPSATWLPFFNYKTGPDGLIVGLGWNGTWCAEFNHHGDGKTDMTAGMERLNTILYPGESIRSPLVMLLYWQGEVMHGQNVFRQFVLAHNHPQENGKPALTPLCCSSWGGTPTEGHLATIAKIAKEKFEYDCYWIDAGWYGQGTDPCPSVFQGDWGSVVGDWRVNLTRHPNTLKPISDALAAMNMKFLLWFETERAICGVPATKEHPEWYLRPGGGHDASDGETLLLNLGNPDARAWVTETISNILRDNKITWYREDFNMVPDGYWSAYDTPDRIGMTEMRFVEGLYKFWDDLRAQNPGLMIDNCASGGRRIELETMKRSIVLWRTDYNCFPYLTTEVTQSHGFGLSHWLPAHATSPFLVTGIDDYQGRSALSSGAILSASEFNNGNPTPEMELWVKEKVAEAKACRPYFYGDFYPLTQGNWSDDAWLAYAMYRPAERDGLIVAYRRPKSPVISLGVALPMVDSDKNYEFRDGDTNETWQVQGRDIREKGFTITIDQPRKSKLIFWRELPLEN
ncbi:MAG: alpha-galactosidase [Planctomycetia bacterium]|nr:alpha-galactosidase [Planctomycetia bacterium]